MSTATALAPRDPKPPFLPSDLDVGRAVSRTFAAHVLAALSHGEQAVDIARRRWPRDHLAAVIVERTASASATTSQSGWAAELSGQATGAFLGSLQPSAGASLIAAGSRFSLDGVRQVNLPAAQTGSVTATFVAERAPIPVAQGIINSVALTPSKLAISAVMTREVAEHGVEAENGISGVEMTILDATRLALDSALFSSAAAGVGPAGLLHSIAATTAATGATGALAALSDCRALVDACSAGGGAADVRFFASPGRALALKSYLDEAAPPIYGSAAIPATQLIAIDCAAFASAFDSIPRVEASREAVVHMESSAPAAIGTPGTPPVVAAPSISAWQVDCVVVKVALRCGFVMRYGAIAHIDTGMVW